MDKDAKSDRLIKTWVFFVQCVAVSWSYGINRAIKDLATMGMTLNKFLRFYWRAVWTVIVPFGSIVSIYYYTIMLLLLSLQYRRPSIIYKQDGCTFVRMNGL